MTTIYDLERENARLRAERMLIRAFFDRPGYREGALLHVSPAETTHQPQQTEDSHG